MAPSISHNTASCGELTPKMIIKYKIPLILFFVSVIILLQSPCAPFANKVAEYDGGVFIYSAKQMINGGLIYKDIFDHKGPVLYLLDAVGLILFNGNLTGIWFMELICLFITSVFLFKTAQLFADQFISSLTTIYSLFVLVALEPGHGTQYYALPFISLSLYLFLKCLKHQSILSIYQIIAISIAFTITLLLQPNLVTIWLAFGVVVAMDLLIRKCFGRLIRSFLLVSIIISATLLPFIIYAIHNKLLSDAISCYWLFNRINPGPSINIIAKGAYYALVNIDKGHAFIPLFFYVVYLSSHWRRIDNLTMHIAICISLALTVTVGCGLSGRNYPHYAIIIVPLLCIITTFCLTTMKTTLGNSNCYCVLIVIALSWRLLVLQAQYSYLAYKPNPQVINVVDIIKSNSTSTDCIAVVGNDSQLYYLSDRRSCSKYHYTLPILDVKGFHIDMQKEYQKELANNKPKLIIIKTGDYPHPPEFIEEILAKNYSKMDYQDKYVDIYKQK